MEQIEVSGPKTTISLGLDWGLLFHRFIQWVLLLLVAVSTHFLKKIDDRLEALERKQNDSEIIISSHAARLNSVESDIVYYRGRMASIEDALRK